MENQISISDQVKDLFNGMKERYTNPFAIIFTSYIIYHNWKFFFILFSETTLEFQKRFELADNYWTINSMLDILIGIGYTILVLLLSLAFSTFSKSLIDFWNKHIRNRVIGYIDKTEIATKHSLNLWKSECAILTKKLNDSENTNNAQLDVINTTRIDNGRLKSELDELRKTHDNLLSKINSHHLLECFMEVSSRSDSTSSILKYIEEKAREYQGKNVPAEEYFHIIHEYKSLSYLFTKGSDGTFRFKNEIKNILNVLFEIERSNPLYGVLNHVNSPIL